MNEGRVFDLICLVVYLGIGLITIVSSLMSGDYHIAEITRMVCLTILVLYYREEVNMQ